MSTILTSVNISDAKSAVEKYVSTITSINSKLASTISSLTGESFIGDASDGYNEFYTTKVVPAIEENLTALTDSIKSILDSIEENILNTMDPNLGNQNREAGSTTATA